MIKTENKTTVELNSQQMISFTLIMILFTILTIIVIQNIIMYIQQLF